MHGRLEYDMNRKFNVVIAVVARLLGSAIMQYAFGQNQPAVAREIRAQSIVLVDPANVVVGTFTSELIPNGVSVLAPGVLPKSRIVSCSAIRRDASSGLRRIRQSSCRLAQSESGGACAPKFNGSHGPSQTCHG